MNLIDYLVGAAACLVSACVGAYIFYRAFQVGKVTAWYEQHDADQQPPDIESVVPSEDTEFLSAEEIESRVEPTNAIPEGLR